MSQSAFLGSLPDVLRPLLPEHLRKFQVRRPWGGLLQLHFGEPSLHYEVFHVGGRPGQLVQGWELGFHWEARDHRLNRFLLDGFRRNLFEIKSELGETIEAEMWDKGWTKIYEVFPDAPLSTDYQQAVAERLADIMTCLQPIFADLRGRVAQVYR